MIPVDQVRTGNPQGQCTEASIASVLEVPLDAIPDLWGGDEEQEARPLRQWVQMIGFIVGTGHQFVRYNIPEQTLPVDLDSLNLPHAARFVARGFHLLAGDNPDGCGHMCVGKDGALVHDPNPSRRGLTSVDEITVLIPLEMVADADLGLMTDYTLSPDGEWVVTMGENRTHEK